MFSTERLLLALGLLLSLALLAGFPRFTVDDAFILFRYATNLAEHGALTWNVGEDPVEGYTGVALPVLLALLHEAGLAPLVASKIVGVLAFYAGAAVLYAFGRALRLTGWVRALLVLLYLLAPFLYTHAVSGLETTLFAASVAASLYLLHGWCLSPPGRRTRWACLLMGGLLLCSLVRPEGAALAGLAMLAVLVVALWQPRAWGGTAAAVGAIYLLPGGLYFAWRWSYYGQLLPNTFYVKQSALNIQSIWALEAFLSGFALVGALAVLLLAAETDRVWARLRGAPGEERAALATTGGVAVAFAATLCVFYLRSDLIMNYSHRFFVPLLPILLAAFCLAIDRGWRAVQESAREKPLRRRFVQGVVALALLAQALVYARGFPDEFRYTSTYGRMLRDEHVRVGHWLREHIPDSEWLAVVSDAGAIPYYSGLKTVDFGGLNDERLGRLPPSERADYFFSANPGAAVFSSYARDSLVDNPDAAGIPSDPRFERYEHVRTYASDAREFYQILYVRRDLLAGAPGPDGGSAGRSR